MLKVLDK